MLYGLLTEEREYAANGVVIPKHAFMVLEPGCEFCIATKFEHGALGARPICGAVSKAVWGAAIGDPPREASVIGVQRSAFSVSVSDGETLGHPPEVQDPAAGTESRCPPPSRPR